MLRINHNSLHIAQASSQQEYIPLKQVRVEATIKTFGADVTIKQIFRNDENIPIEAVYCFPIEEQAAVYGFTARIDDREIVAELKEKKRSQEEYSEALRHGHGAYLLEQDEKSPDNFIINVGALPPGKECHISISYVSELELVQNGQKIRFVVPTTIAPRYDPNKGGINSPAGTTSKYVQSTPYTIEFRCQVEKIGISKVSSLSHPIQVDFSQSDMFLIEFTQQNTHLDRDILLDIDLAESRTNIIIAVEPGAVMASFIPTEKDFHHLRDHRDIINEFIFVVDCSGSMEDDSKIGLARQAMLLFLKSLPVQCHFNIIQFGSSYEKLFDQVTAVYNEVNVQRAEKLINQMQADLGGTELLKPLQWLEEHPPEQGRARQIFLLTDGEISNVNEVLDLCRSMSTTTRIFSFGLGHSPSRSLVKGLARATNGRFVFIPPNSSVDIHVGQQLQKALQSCITNVQVKWNLGTTIMSVPTKIPPIYANDRLLVYALADDPMFAFEHNSKIELYQDQYRLGEAVIDRIPYVSNNGVIARLAGKALILELQHAKLPKNNTQGSLQSRFQEYHASSSSTTAVADEKQAKKKQIIELSLKYHILSPYTAFIGVEKRTNGNNAEMVLREVPIQISADDQRLRERSLFDVFDPTSMLFMAQSSNSVMCKKLPRLPAFCSSPSRKLVKSKIIQKPKHEEVQSQSFDGGSYSLKIQEASTLLDFDSDLNQRETEIVPEQKVKASDDESLVRSLISKQKFDGRWELNVDVIQQLTGKPFTCFPQLDNSDTIMSAIVVVLLENRFTSLSALWYGVVQKARQYLLYSMNNNSQQLEDLLNRIRQQL